MTAIGSSRARSSYSSKAGRSARPAMRSATSGRTARIASGAMGSGRQACDTCAVQRVVRGARRASGSRAARRSRRRRAACRSAPRTGPRGARRRCSRRATAPATPSSPRPRRRARPPASPRRPDTDRRRAGRAARSGASGRDRSTTPSYDHRLDAEVPRDGLDVGREVARRRRAVVVDAGAGPARPGGLDRPVAEPEGAVDRAGLREACARSARRGRRRSGSRRAAPGCGVKPTSVAGPAAGSSTAHTPQCGVLAAEPAVAAQPRALARAPARPGRARRSSR